MRTRFAPVLAAARPHLVTPSLNTLYNEKCTRRNHTLTRTTGEKTKEAKKPDPKNMSKCESCERTIPCCSSVCQHCGKVQSAASPTLTVCGGCSHFDLLGLDSTYQINPKELEKKYKDLLMKIHPDKHSGQEKIKAEERSVTLNHAFSILKNPLKRAVYMLQQKGVSALKEDHGARSETDFAILTEAMNLREELDSTDKAGLAPLRKRLTNNIEELQQELASSIGDATQIDAAVKSALRMRYLEKVLEELDEKASNA